MRRLIYLVITANFLLVFMLGNSYCHAAASSYQLEWDYLPSVRDDYNLDTVSLHIFKKFSETPNRSIYRGITITRPWGEILQGNHYKNSSAVGVGPVCMVRYEKHCSNKLSAALDISGGFILYNERYPAGGEYYNFMWRIGPKLIYSFNKNSSVHIGYTYMHVSNGLDTNNPGDDAGGISLSFTAKF